MKNRPGSVDIRVAPWFADHAFNGRAVLPAVESLQIMARAARQSHPGIDIRVMEEVRFSKFLEIPAESTTVAALISIEEEPGGIRVTLASRVRFKAFSRIKEHGTVLFPAAPGPDETAQATLGPPLNAPLTAVTAETIYRDLVPFGPAYRSLAGTLHLWAGAARGTVRAPDFTDTAGVGEILGSPFPLDGAFHAACVLGQQLVDFVPFPVGFARRVIHRPTRPKACYGVEAVLVDRKEDELVFDLAIFAGKDEIFEEVTGVRMRDVGVRNQKSENRGQKSDIG